MDIDVAKLEPVRSYAAGEVIEVDEKSLRAIIERAEEVLGVQKRPREFKILYFPQAVSTLIGGAFSAEEKRFHVPQKQHEATLFHEATHYLMFEEGLLFGPHTSKATFYDCLLDETVAEFAASGVYDYDDFHKNMVSIYERMRKGDPVAIQQFKDTLPPGFLQTPLETLLPWMDFSQLDIISRQRAIEERYRKEGFDGIEKDVDELYHSFGHLHPAKGYVLIREATRMLAIENAIALRNKNIKPKELVACLKDGVANGWDSYGLYFCDVAVSMK
ncbi:hypothetical protein HZB03_00120 [Candidatus Woesearchaeota archaeon]|nr:hypothetical protein [Candidatus Woesearchaeota archaeon]